jgi:hypothetical protein
MLRALRNRITPGTVIATIALVFAMTGGAYAANKFLITSTKQISPKVLKSLKGANGKNGLAGPAGPAGAAGAGTAGAAGPQGPAGPGGAKGESGAPGAPGAPGAKGTTGSPWTAGGTLPKGSTETGVWAFGPVPNEGGESTQVPISFTIPLAAPLDGSHVHFINTAGMEVLFGEPNTEVTPTECGTPVGTVAQPTSASGNLCVYESFLENSESFSQGIALPQGGEGAGSTGALETFNLSAGVAKGRGSWAVTG